MQIRPQMIDKYSVSADQELQFNPQVTVRSRGVMEKCTFCVQRVNAAKFKAANDGKDLATDAIVTACQQACPAAAIVFGDLNDPQSQVAQILMMLAPIVMAYLGKQKREQGLDAGRTKRGLILLRDHAADDQQLVAAALLAQQAGELRYVAHVRGGER